MRELLEAVLGPFDRILGAIPLAAARWFIVGVFSMAAVAALLLPREFVYRGAPDQRWYRDLRWWGVAITAPYVLLYVLL